MKNLNKQEQKLLFNGVLIILGILLCSALYWGGNKAIQYFEYKATKEKFEIIQKYENKISSLDSINRNLFTKIQWLDYEVDSLQKVKNKIIWRYGEKVNVIYNASAADNAKWLDSVLTKVDNN